MLNFLKSGQGRTEPPRQKRRKNPQILRKSPWNQGHHWQEKRPWKQNERRGLQNPNLNLFLRLIRRKRRPRRPRQSRKHHQINQSQNQNQRSQSLNQPLSQKQSPRPHLHLLRRQKQKSHITRVNVRRQNLLQRYLSGGGMLFLTGHLLTMSTIRLPMAKSRQLQDIQGFTLTYSRRSSTCVLRTRVHLSTIFLRSHRTS